MPRLLALLLCLAASPALAADSGWRDPTPPTTTEVSIRSQAGQATFSVLVADTEEARVRGLAGRAPGPNEGILYDFGTPAPVRMWTRHDKAPLDMAFIGQEGAVSFVRKDLGPGDATPVQSPVPVRFVLEVPAGTLDRYGITVGDAVAIGREDPGEGR